MDIEKIRDVSKPAKMNPNLKYIFFLKLIFLFGFSIPRLAFPAGPTNTAAIQSLLRSSEKYLYIFPDSSILFAEEAIARTDTIADAAYLSQAYSTLAAAYYLKGFNGQSLDYYFKALRIDEASGDSSDISKDLNNIGNIFLIQKKFDKAYEYFSSALRIKYDLKDHKGIAHTLLSITNIYIANQETELALEHAYRALSIFDSLHDNENLVVVYTTLGSIRNSMNNSDDALKYFNKALQLSKETRDFQNECVLSINIGNVYANEGKNSKAILYYENALELAQDINYLEGLSSAFEKLYLTYETLKMPDEAYQYYKLYIYMRDSLQRKENIEALVKNELEYKFEKERERTRMEQEKKELLAEEHEKRQDLITVSIFILFCGALLIVFLIFRSYRQKQKANQQLKQKNKIIQQQNRDITDSIEYALRIQGALLNSEYLFKKLNLDYFILYLPKNIVSGDFYWISSIPGPSLLGEGSNTRSPLMGEAGGGLLLCTADSTGHGVPGALMSVIGIMLLDEIIVQKGITRPDAALNALRNELIKILNPEGSKEKTHDGMDMVLCRITPPGANGKSDSKGLLEFAAANNPVYLVRQGELMEFSPDKMPVGLHYGVIQPFKNKEVPLEKGDVIYTITDGFPDQLGGPKGKKLKYNVMKELFVSIHRLPMDEQKKEIEKAFRNWKGETEQTDDICIVGIRV